MVERCTSVAWVPLPPSKREAVDDTLEFVRIWLLGHHGLALSEVAPILSEVYASILVGLCKQEGGYDIPDGAQGCTGKIC